MLLKVPASADQIEMLNGDRYFGRVTSLGEDTLVLKSDVLGTLKLPRSKISTISLSSVAPVRSTNAVRLPQLLSSSNSLAKSSSVVRPNNTSADLSSVMQELGSNSNMIQQVQQQLLGGAGPEAQTKFNDLLGGLMSGKIDLQGLRAEAKSTLAQAQSARKELGDENGSMLDSYLGILESFLKETESETAPTNTVNRLAMPVDPAAPKPLDGE